MGRRYDTVSFLSDFGLDDEFVGVVRSVIRSLAPEVAVVDITHGIARHDVRAGSLALVRSVQYLAPGLVLAVVDPGVGTDRRGVAVTAGDDDEAVFVGPDNGLLAAAVAMVGGANRAVELTNAGYQLPAPGPTFAGRDVFAPAAAHLCNGVDLAELGEAVDPITLRPGIVPLSRREDERLVAEVLWIDRFGNAQLNVDPDEMVELGDRVSLRWSADQVRTARRAPTYGDLKPGEIGLVVDSYGLVSVALDRRSAAEELRLRPGDAMTLEAAK
ncbi:MAG: SAM hydrolase/SAM-dependent halogenase family protein [Acidimicrobiales bacterium]